MLGEGEGEEGREGAGSISAREERHLIESLSALGYHCFTTGGGGGGVEVRSS